MKRFRFIIFLISIFLFYYSALSQGHFIPVENTGIYSSIIIEDVVVINSDIFYGDEIGVFDGNLCVGAVVYKGEFPVQCSASMKFQEYSGAEAGNPMSFKLWQQTENEEFDASPVYEQGGEFDDTKLTVVNRLQVLQQTTINDNSKTVPEDYCLNQNYPNPFNPATTISYSIPKADEIHINIYNMTGNKIKTFVKVHKHAGYYSVVWSGENDSGYSVSSGVYLVRFHTSEYNASRKIMLLH